MEDLRMEKSGKLLWILSWILTAVGAAICLGTAAFITSIQPHDLWPIPGFYLIEICLLALLGLLSRIRWKDVNKFRLDLIPWMITGALLPIMILGILSIGIFIFPAMISFFIVGLIAELSGTQNLAKHAGWAVIAAVCQAGIMILFLVL